MRIDLLLVGFGHVGRRFAQLLEESRPALADLGIEPRVVGIVTRRHGAVLESAGLDAIRAARIVTDGGAIGPAPTPSALELIARWRPDVAAARVMVETTPLDVRSGEPAVSHIRAAFAAGIDVVTANKGPIACAWRDLADEAARTGRQLRFEGAVMDGIPIFNLVRETMPAATIAGFRGVVNSTTNYLIDAMERGEAFDAALARMQAAGVAEADPSLDVDGWDAAAKVSALANVFMRARTTPLAVEREGIGPSIGRQAMAAKARGARVRLVGSARTTPDGVVTSVRPVELPETDLLAGLRGMGNALVLTTDLLGDVAICQLSGSLTQTAYALLSDLVTIRRRLHPVPAAAAR